MPTSNEKFIAYINQPVSNSISESSNRFAYLYMTDPIFRHCATGRAGYHMMYRKKYGDLSKK